MFWSCLRWLDPLSSHVKAMDKFMFAVRIRYVRGNGQPSAVSRWFDVAFLFAWSIFVLRADGWTNMGLNNCQAPPSYRGRHASSSFRGPCGAFNETGACRRQQSFVGMSISSKQKFVEECKAPWCNSVDYCMASDTCSWAIWVSGLVRICVRMVVISTLCAHKALLNNTPWFCFFSLFMGSVMRWPYFA